MLMQLWVKAAGGWWRHRNRCLAARGPWRRLQVAVQKRYVEQQGGYVSLLAEFAGPPTLPHKLLGVFVAPGTTIGEGVTIYQHVMLAKNDMPGSPWHGAPTIGDGVYLGAGAKVVGAVTVGAGARIGAGAVVVRDVPAGATVVSAPNRVIVREAAVHRR
jgi:serine O-acetyltransferase